MQELSRDILVKSLSFNTFYPRDFSSIKKSPLRFSSDINDDCHAFVSDDFDELGYARRYSDKRIFYKTKCLNEEQLIKASIYGADGVLISSSIDAKTLELLKNCGLLLAFFAEGKIDLFKAVLSKADIIIADENALKNIPENKLKGILCNT